MVVATGKTLEADLKKWKITTQRQAETLMRGAILELARMVVLDSPVLTGFFRGSWQPSIGQEPMHSSDARPDPDGVRAISEVSFTVAQMKLGATFFMVNNARYGMRLENGFVGVDALGRSYNQPGQFFVASQVLGWQDIVDAEAASLRFEGLSGTDGA